MDHNPFAPPVNVPSIPSQAQSDAALTGGTPIPANPPPLVANPPITPAPMPIPAGLNSPVAGSELNLDDIVATMKQEGFKSFIIVGINDKGALLTARSLGSNAQTYAMVGALEVMKHNMIRKETPQGD